MKKCFRNRRWLFVNHWREEKKTTKNNLIVFWCQWKTRFVLVQVLSQSHCSSKALRFRFISFLFCLTRIFFSLSMFPNPLPYVTNWNVAVYRKVESVGQSSFYTHDSSQNPNSQSIYASFYVQLTAQADSQGPTRSDVLYFRSQPIQVQKSNPNSQNLPFTITQINDFKLQPETAPVFSAGPSSSSSSKFYNAEQQSVRKFNWNRTFFFLTDTTASDLIDEIHSSSLRHVKEQLTFVSNQSIDFFLKVSTNIRTERRRYCFKRKRFSAFYFSIRRHKVKKNFHFETNKTKETFDLISDSKVIRPYLIFVTDETHVGQLFDAQIFRKTFHFEIFLHFRSSFEGINQIATVSLRESSDDENFVSGIKWDVEICIEIKENRFIYVLENYSKVVVFIIRRVLKQIQHSGIDIFLISLMTSSCVLNEWFKVTILIIDSFGKKRNGWKQKWTFFSLGIVHFVYRCWDLMLIFVTGHRKLCVVESKRIRDETKLIFG